MFVRFCVCAADGTRNISAPTGAEIKVLPPSSWRQANVHRTLAFNYSSPYYTKEPDTHLGIRFFGAADGTRTRTVSLPGDFKSPVSTDSTTAAATWYDTIFLFYRQGGFMGGKGGRTAKDARKNHHFYTFSWTDPK